MPITPTTSTIALANLSTIPLSTTSVAGTGSVSGGSSNSISVISSSHPGGLAGSLLTVATAVPVTNALTLTTNIPTQSSANHLDVPPSSNPNLLSPDVINQRRGWWQSIR